MKRETVGELIFWSAAAFAFALYALTVPDGIPWHPAAEEGRVWRHLVAMAGGSAQTLACFAAALAAGLLGALVNCYCGWRCALAASIVWTFMPGVWNRAILGERGAVLASAVALAAWVGNAIVRWTLRKARATRAAQLPDLVGDHATNAVRGRANSIVGGVILSLAALFAVISSSMHDYRLGEAASAYARLIVEEAGNRIILLNGVCDEQIVAEAKLKLGDDDRILPVSLLSLGANVSNVIAFAKRTCPAETNLWLAAAVSPKAFAETIARMHPESFYAMTGASTTPEEWTARWAAMAPYVKSGDAFVSVLRHLFAYEGNAIGSALLSSAPTPQHSTLDSQPSVSSAKVKQAWRLYYRIFTEIHPNDPTACVNLNRMLRRGYKVDEMTRKRLESAQADYTKHLRNRAKLLRLAAKGEKTSPPEIPDLKTLEEWHPKMMKAFNTGDFDTSVRIARAILARRAWRRFVPANFVLGEKMMMEGDWVLAEPFLRVAATATGAAAPEPMVLNDYAETLRQLKRCDEAETFARRAVAKADVKTEWFCHLTLAQVLRDKGKAKGNVEVEGEGAEIQSLVNDVLKYAPPKMRNKVRKEFP